MMDYTEVIFYVSEMVLVLSYSVTRMIALRFLACLADIGYVTASLLIGLQEPGMMPTFIFAVIAFFLNAIHIYRLLRMKIPIKLPTEYQNVYNEKFSSFTCREFLHLLNISTSITSENSEIIQEGKPCDIFLCLDGELSVKVDGKDVATLPAASFVGEVSALTDNNSMASVSTLRKSHLCQWTSATRKQLEKKYPEIYLKFHSVLLGEMRSKLKSQNLCIAY